jgi:uncharacterized RDD family membrane protein YckC
MNTTRPRTSSGAFLSQKRFQFTLNHFARRTLLQTRAASSDKVILCLNKNWKRGKKGPRTMPNLPDPFNQPQFYSSVPSKRLIAWIVDLVVIIGLSLLALPLTGFLGLFFWPVMLLAIGFAYRVVTLANGSATWGMRFAGVELRDAHGARFDLSQALAHTLGYSISMAFPILQVISVVMMLTGARKQGLTDAFMGTVALNRRAES